MNSAMFCSRRHFDRELSDMRSELLQQAPPVCGEAAGAGMLLLAGTWLSYIFAALANIPSIMR